MGLFDAVKGANLNFGTVDSPDFIACYLTTKGDHFMITGGQSGTYEFTLSDVSEFKAIASGGNWVKWKMAFKNGKVAIITSTVSVGGDKSGVSMAPIERFFGSLL